MNSTSIFQSLYLVYHLYTNNFSSVYFPVKGSPQSVDVHRGSGGWRCSSPAPLSCNVAAFPQITGRPCSLGHTGSESCPMRLLAGSQGFRWAPVGFGKPLLGLWGGDLPWVLSSFSLSLLPRPWPPPPPTSLFLEGRVGVRVSHASGGVGLSLLTFLTFVPQRFCCCMIFDFWNYGIPILFIWITELLGVTLKFWLVSPWPGPASSSFPRALTVPGSYCIRVMSIRGTQLSVLICMVWSFLIKKHNFTNTIQMHTPAIKKDLLYCFIYVIYKFKYSLQHFSLILKFLHLLHCKILENIFLSIMKKIKVTLIRHLSEDHG